MTVKSRGPQPSEARYQAGRGAVLQRETDRARRLPRPSVLQQRPEAAESFMVDLSLPWWEFAMPPSATFCAALLGAFATPRSRTLEILVDGKISIQTQQGDKP